MSDCWVCKQKAEWKNELINAAKLKAKLQANEQGKTMAIIKEGCNYTIITASDATGTVFEYIPAD
jgi:hypothetical protein